MKSEVENVSNEKKMKIAAHDDVGFLYKHFMQTFFSYRKTFKNTVERKNGYCSLTLVTSSEELGLPYGMMPRMLMIWLISKSITSQNNRILLPSSLSTFIDELGFRRNGGVRGDITRLKEQFIKLVHTAFSVKFHDSEIYQVLNLFIIEEAHLWWDKENNNDFIAQIRLSEGFYKEIKQNCVPINLSIIHQLSHSCLAMDIYTWLAFRMGYVTDRTYIPWESLKAQFGFEYNSNKKGMANFKTEFNTQLNKVCSLYTEAKIFISEDKKGFVLYPSPTSVPRNVVKLHPKRKIASQLTQENLENVEKSKHELNELISNDFGLSATLATKLTKTKTVDQINQSIASVKEIVFSGKAINVKALIRKAIDEEWKPKVAFITNHEAPCNIKDQPEFAEEKDINPEWQNVRMSIKKRLGDATFNSWINKLKYVEKGGTTVRLSVASSFIKNYIEDRYKEVILVAWQQVVHSITNVKIDIDC